MTVLNSTLNNLPGRSDGWIVPGDPASAAIALPVDVPSVTLNIADRLSVAGTLDTAASAPGRQVWRWRLTAAQVTTALGTPAETVMVPWRATTGVGDDLSPLAAGELRVVSKWTAGYQQMFDSALVLIGPPGASTAEAEDARDAALLAQAAAEDARDAAQYIADTLGGTPDGAVAALVDDPDSATRLALSSTYAPRTALAFNAWQDFYAKCRNQQADVNLLLVGDSTLDWANTVQSWAYGLAEGIGEMFPTHTVIRHTWNTATGTDWNAATTTVQTGTGYRADLAAPPTIHVWVGGASGQGWRYFFRDARRFAFWKTPNPDVVMIALGHNDAPGVPEPGVWGRNLVLVEWARTLCPLAQFILSSQNPRDISGEAHGRAELRNDIYRRMARERGYGYLNVTQAFYDDGRSLARGGPLIDALGTHPTAVAVAEIWLPLILRQIAASPDAPVLPTSPPSITIAGTPLATTKPLPIASNGWTLTNCTEATEATIKLRASSSLKLTKAAGLSTAHAGYSLNPVHVKGRRVCCVAWVYIPSTSVGDSVNVWLVQDNVLIAYSITETVIRDEWFPICVVADVPATAPWVSVRLFINSAATAEQPVVYVDSLAVFLGSLPLDSPA